MDENHQREPRLGALSSVFLDEAGRVYKVARWCRGGDWWLFYRQPTTGLWAKLRPVTQDDLWEMLPRLLPAERAAEYT